MTDYSKIEKEVDAAAEMMGRGIKRVGICRTRIQGV